MGSGSSRFSSDCPGSMMMDLYCVKGGFRESLVDFGWEEERRCGWRHTVSTVVTFHLYFAMSFEFRWLREGMEVVYILI